LANSAEKLYSEADLIYRLERDEEKAYIFYMRYVNIIQILMKSDLKSTIKKGILEIALSRCEELSASLSKRYGISKEIDKLETADELRRKEVHIPKTATLNGIIQKNQEKEDPSDITPAQLKNLIEQKSSRILIVDSRSGADFRSSHPKHPNCISVPSEILVRG
jgi:ubiquitin carboxyl-terminal hydrolase 8